MMNLGDKTRSVTVRLSPALYDFLSASAKAINVTPSQFVRMMIAGVKSMHDSSGDFVAGIAKDIEANK